MSQFELNHSAGDNADENACLPATQAQLIKKIAKM